jgi:hypothetical protein
MARVIPIDVIKGISGKYGNGSNDYFATNSSSGRIRLAKFEHPYQGPATEKQLAQQKKFAARQAAVSAWLNANKPSEQNGAKGSEAYQLAQKLKRQMTLSNITQVVFKYMDGDNVVKLPKPGEPIAPVINNGGDNGNTGAGGGGSQGSGSGDNGGGSEV